MAGTDSETNLGSSIFGIFGFLKRFTIASSASDSSRILSYRSQCFGWPRFACISGREERSWDYNNSGLGLLANCNQQAGGASHDMRKSKNILLGSQVKRNSSSSSCNASFLPANCMREPIASANRPKVGSTQLPSYMHGPRPSRFPYAGFLDTCYRCKKDMRKLKIYMWKGEFAFCSEECRDDEMSDQEMREVASANCEGSDDSSFQEEIVFAKRH